MPLQSASQSVESVDQPQVDHQARPAPVASFDVGLIARRVAMAASGPVKVEMLVHQAALGDADLFERELTRRVAYVTAGSGGARISAEFNSGLVHVQVTSDMAGIPSTITLPAVPI